MTTQEIVIGIITLICSSGLFIWLNEKYNQQQFRKNKDQSLTGKVRLMSGWLRVQITFCIFLGLVVTGLVIYLIRCII